MPIGQWIFPTLLKLIIFKLFNTDNQFQPKLDCSLYSYGTTDRFILLLNTSLLPSKASNIYLMFTIYFTEPIS